MSDTRMHSTMVETAERTGVMIAAGVSEQGGFRKANEDCFYVDEPAGLCIVADGMGGHRAGDVAARVAVDAVRDCVRLGVQETEAWMFGAEPGLSEDGNLLRTAVHLANARILEASDGVEAYAGMGTTLVVTLLRGRTLTTAHVGDSRAYLCAGGTAAQLTRDDSWLAAMMELPGADLAVLQHHPLRNALTSVVGGRISLEVHVAERTLADDEYVLLTTDGVHGVLEPSVMASAVGAGGEPCLAARRLVQLALDRGSRDNCTAVVAGPRLTSLR
jgi:PPM family protein phosphatase